MDPSSQPPRNSRHSAKPSSERSSTPSASGSREPELDLAKLPRGLRNLDPSLLSSLYGWRYPNGTGGTSPASSLPKGPPLSHPGTKAVPSLSNKPASSKSTTHEAPIPGNALFDAASSEPFVASRFKASAGWTLFGICACLSSTIAGGYGLSKWNPPSQASAEMVSSLPRILPALARTEAALAARFKAFASYLRKHQHALPEPLKAPVDVELSSGAGVRRTLNDFQERFEALLDSGAVSNQDKHLASIWQTACRTGVRCWDCSEERGTAFMLDAFYRLQ